MGIDINKSRFEIGLLINRLGMMMDTPTFERCRSTMDELNSKLVNLFDELEKQEEVLNAGAD